MELRQLPTSRMLIGCLCGVMLEAGRILEVGRREERKRLGEGDGEGCGGKQAASFLDCV